MIPLPHHFPMGPFGGKIGPMPGTFRFKPLPAFISRHHFPHRRRLPLPVFFRGPRGPMLFPRSPVRGMVFRGRWGVGSHPFPRQTILSPSPVLGPYSRVFPFHPEFHNYRGTRPSGTGFKADPSSRADTRKKGVGIGVGIDVGGTSKSNRGVGVGIGIGVGGSTAHNSLRPVDGISNDRRKGIGIDFGIDIGHHVGHSGRTGIRVGIDATVGDRLGRRSGLVSGDLFNRFRLGPRPGLLGVNGGPIRSTLRFGVGVPKYGSRGFGRSWYPFTGFPRFVRGMTGIGSSRAIWVPGSIISGPIIRHSGSTDGCCVEIGFGVGDRPEISNVGGSIGLGNNGQNVGGAKATGVGLGVGSGGDTGGSGKAAAAGNILSTGGSYNIVEVIGPLGGPSGTGIESGHGIYSNNGMEQLGNNKMGLIIGPSAGNSILGGNNGYMMASGSGVGVRDNIIPFGTATSGFGGERGGGAGNFWSPGDRESSGSTGGAVSRVWPDLRHQNAPNVTNNIFIGSGAEVSENSFMGATGLEPYV